MANAVRLLLFALATLGIATSAQAESPSWVDVSTRGFARLELDDEVLAGPAYGFGFEAVAHVYEPLWLGAYAEWGRPTLFSEVNPCTQGCSRSERMIGGVVGVVLPIEGPGRLRVEAGAGHRHHVEDRGKSRWVGNGVDFLRLSIGYDLPVAGPAYLGGFYDWSMGCFTSYRLEQQGSATVDLGGTCPKRPWISTGLGLRAGISL